MIALIGAGPLGIEMAVALKQARLPYVHLEQGQIGSTMEWWAPGTRWFSSNDRISISGVPLVTPTQEKATREEYLAYLRAVVEQFDLDIRTYTCVTRISRQGNGFVINCTRAGQEGRGAPEAIQVSTVIFATGGTASPNLMTVPGEGLPHVSHYFKDPHAYFRRQLLIVGGRNSAVEAALRSHRAGATVHFCHYAADVDAKAIKYWLYPEFSSLVKAGKIVGHFNTRVTAITPTHVSLARADGGEAVELPVDFVLLLTGYLADMSLIRQSGVTLTGDQEIPAFNTQTMETNVPGIYVAGTAIAGTQRRYKIFLENCHVHVGRILAHLTGKEPPPDAVPFERAES